MRTTEKRKHRALPSITRAHRSAKDRSKAGNDVFVSEWVDEPGRFSAIAEREYHNDTGQGGFFRDAVAVYSDGKLTT